MKNLLILNFKLLMVSTFLCLFSCKEDANIYSIDPKLDPYLQRFLKAGEERGHHFDLKEDGLIMEFAHLEPPTIGLCYYTNPIKIQIDVDYWRKTTTSDNQENLREEVVFHELGHGLFPRIHKNDLLPNTEWASIMRGGDTLVQGRNWVINFNGFRKKYYLDELFDRNCPAPDWATSGKLFAGNKGDTLKAHDFAKNSYSEKTFDKTTTIVENGYLNIYQKGHNAYFALTSMPEENTSNDNFYFEVELLCCSDSCDNDDFPYGIFIGSLDHQESALFNKNNHMFILNNKRINYDAEVHIDKFLNSSGTNTISIHSENGLVHTYINNKHAYTNEIYAKNTTTHFGVYVRENSHVKVKRYSLYGTKNTSGIKSGASDEDEHFTILKAPALPDQYKQ